jgi:hypothetical protein
MRSMTRKERRVFERLVRLAGTPVLVAEALRETSREFDGPTPLERVVQYINARRGHRPRSAASLP